MYRDITKFQVMFFLLCDAVHLISFYLGMVTNMAVS